MSFGTGLCGICGKRIRWDDEFCSDLCQAEADRRGEEGGCVICGEETRNGSSWCPRCQASLEEDRHNREVYGG